MLDPQASITTQNAYLPAAGEQGIATKIIQITNALPEWQRRWTNTARNHEMRRGNVWTAAEAAQIRAQGREPMILPIVEPIIRNLEGRMAAEPLEWKIYPQRPQDGADEKAVLAAKAMRAIAQQNSYTLSGARQIFMDAMSGFGVAGLYIDTNDYGEDTVILERVDWREIMWDITARDPSLKDARWMCRQMMRTVPELVTMYPDKEDIINRFYAYQDESIFTHSVMFQTGNQPVTDQMMVPLNEFFERRDFDVIELTDPNTDGDVTTNYDTLEEAEAELEKRMVAYQQKSEMIAQMGEMPVPIAQCTIERRREKRIVQTCFIAQTLIEENVLEQDHFPYIPFCVFWDGGDFWSFMDIVKHPQMLFQRLMSQIDYIMGTSPKNTLLIDSKKLADGADIASIREEIARTGAVVDFPLKSGDFDAAIHAVQNNAVSPDWYKVAQIVKNVLNDIMPSNAFGSAVPGSEGGAPDQSGRAIALQQRAADAGVEAIFASWRFFHQMVGEHLLFMLQHYVSTPMTLNLLGRDAGMEYVTLNSLPGGADSIMDERLLVTVSDTQYSASTKAMSNQQVAGLMQQQAVMQLLMQVAPQVVPVILESFIETSELPLDVQEKVKAALQMPPPMMPPGQMPPAMAGGAPQAAGQSGAAAPVHATPSEMMGHMAN